MYSTRNHPNPSGQAPYQRFKSATLDNPAKLLRDHYLAFLNRLTVEPELVGQLGLLPTPPLQPPTPQPKPPSTQPSKQPKLQNYAPPRLRFKKTSIQDRLLVEDLAPMQIEDPSSGILVSREFQFSQPNQLLLSPNDLTIEILEQLLSDSEMEIGLTAIVLLCKYLLVENRRLQKGNMLRLFVTASNLAFKLSYQMVSQDFVQFLAKLVECDVKIINALERHFMEALNYDLQVTPHNIKMLVSLIVQ